MPWVIVQRPEVPGGKWVTKYVERAPWLKENA